MATSSAKTPAAQNLLAKGKGETENQFNKLLEAVQSGTVESPVVSDIDTPKTVADFQTLRLLAGTSETTDDVAQTDVSLVANGAEAVATPLPAASEGTAATSVLIPPVQTITASANQILQGIPTETDQVAPVPTQNAETNVVQIATPGTSQPPLTTATATPTALPASTVSPVIPSAPAAPSAHVTTHQTPTTPDATKGSVLQFGNLATNPQTPDQQTLVPSKDTPTAAPTNLQSNDNVTAALALKQQTSGLTPQSQTAVPQTSAALAAASPIAAAQTTELKPNSTTLKTTAPLQQAAIGSNATAEPIDTIRPSVPIDAPKGTLPGALTAAAEPKADVAIATKSVWQTAQDPQPNFLSKPNVNGVIVTPEILATRDVTDSISRTPAEVLQPNSTVGKDLTTTTPAQAAAQKAPVSKPFSEALMMQVKAAEVVDGRTSVHLHPRGLGNIDVEVIAGEKDVASKIIVRVENPIILQHLRDDRQLLAQTIGVSDSALFEFHERGAEQDGKQSDDGQSGFVDTSGDTAELATAPRHADVLSDDRIDILT